MNYVSYLNGDVKITDMPSCTDPMLAKVAQQLNDNICTHTSGDVLCSDCAGIMLRFASRLIGTAQTELSDHETRVLHVRLACGAARRVLHLVREQDRDMCEAAIVAAEGWCDGTVTLVDATTLADAYGHAAAAVTYASARVEAFTQLLDHFDQLTGHTPQQPSVADHVRVLAEIGGR
jgi:hypothetical protein